MLTSFFVFRVIIFPHLYCWYADNAGLSPAEAFLTIPAHCHVFTVSIWIPQLFWFYKMLKGTVKLIKGRTEPKTAATSPERKLTANGNKKEF